MSDAIDNCLKLARTSLSVSVSVLFIWPLHLFAETGVLDQVKIPDDYNLSVVAQDIVHNGHQMEIYQFSTQKDLESVIGHFKALWTDHEQVNPVSGELHPAYFENSIGPWKSVGIIAGHKQIVVQAQSAASLDRTDANTRNRTVGLISGMDITPMFNPPRPPERVSGQGLLLSTTHSNDLTTDSDFGGYESSVSTVLVNGSVRQVKNQLVSSYRRSGWIVQTARDERSVAALLMSRRGETAEVGFTNYDNSRVLVTINRVLRY